MTVEVATVSANANNQMKAFGETTLTYNFNGNLATASEAGVTTTYT